MRALLLFLACAPLPGGGTREIYSRVVSRALERAQKELVATIDFDVDHSRWEDPWVVTSAHYEVRSTHSYGQAAEISRQLEYLHGQFVQLLGEGRSVAHPRGIWIFPNIGDYNKFGNEVGEEHSSLMGCFFAFKHPEQPVATYQNGNLTLLGMWVTHSAVHQFLEQSYGKQNLTWVDEGLAAYFALYWDWNYGATQLRRIVRGPTFVPIERLVNEPIQAYATKPEDRFIELGMLFHYLLNFCETTKNGANGDPSTGPFQEFLRTAVRGGDVSETEFMQTFEEGAALLQEDFKGFDFSSK